MTILEIFMLMFIVTVAIIGIGWFIYESRK